jgi:hypothetical protein
MCGSSQSYNFPQQPTYGEGMADAMKAQMEQLLGQGDFADIYADAGFEGGNLADIIREVEAPLRQQTAQTDTDVLRQTLLGNRQESTSGTYDDQGRLVVGYEGGKEATTVTKNVKPDVEFVEVRKAVVPGIRSNAKRKPAIYKITFKDPNTGSIIQEGFSPFSGKDSDKEMIRSGKTPNGKPVSIGLAPSIDMAADHPLSFNNAPGIGASGQKSLDYFAKQGFTPVDLSNSGKLEATTSTPPKDAVPVYGKDPNGNIIVDKSKAGQTETIPASFSGDGMINLLGDSRNVQEFTTRQATQEDVAAGLASEVGESITEATGDRKAGFDADGNFLGLSAFSEDLARGSLSRQREADLADVERLSDRYRGVMEDYKPAATSGLDDARILLEQQRENLTGLRKPTQAELDADPSLDPDSLINTGTGSDGPIKIPTDDTYGGDVTAATMDAAQVGAAPTLDAKTSFDASQVADPLQLQANTQFQGQLATGTGNQDTLRSALLGDAKTALDTGLTDREQAQIANAARARQTLMGRTFDQSGAIAEAEARVQEDNARRMQNRSFAQSVLGQEAGLQQGDITRGMAQESEQAGLQQRADLTQAQLDQDALRTSMLTGVQQDLDQAKFDQQQTLTQAQMDQQANAFDADALQRSRMGNQAQRQQANQFGVGATMDAERLNETLRQQGLSNYINAVGNLAQMEDKFMLDPFQALLGRGGGNALQQGQSVFGQANYGLSSGPQYLNPEAGLGFISQMAANDAGMYGAQLAADAGRSSGLMGGLGAIGGGLLGGAGAAGGFGKLFS